MEPDIFTSFFNGTITVVLILLAFIIAGLVTLGIMYLLILYHRMKKREKMADEMVTLEVQVPKENEIKVDAAEQMSASFGSLKKTGFWDFFEVDDVLAFEIVARKGEIRFFVTAPNNIVDLVEKTIYGYYPSADIKKVEEPNIFTDHGSVAYTALKHTKDSYLPLKTYKDISNDTIGIMTSALSKMDDDEGAVIQILIRATNGSWKSAGK